ncbi:MAG: ABC transporter substrate-binding protein [Chloroflexota bacterium]
MRRFRASFLLAVVLALLLSLSAVGAQDDKVLHLVFNQDMRTSDPHIAYETETWPMASLFYAGLVKLKDPGTPIPALAESWTISDDGTTFTFKLRPDAKFSNGRDLTADDVKYSFERLLNPQTAAPTAFMFESLVGAKDFEAGTATEVSGVKVIDPHTVEFKTEIPVWTMMQRFALPPAYIVAKEGVEAAGDEFGRQPLGAGPFIIGSWESGVQVTGTRNPYYYEAGQPYFDSFELQLGIESSVEILKIENGEADIALDFVPSSDYPRLAADPVLSKQLIASQGFPNTGYIVVNNNKEPFSDVKVRQAMSMAIDRDRLSQILNGRAVPIGGFLPASVVGHNPDVKAPAYDPEAAKKLLADAGYPDGFSTTMLSNLFPNDLAMAQAVVADLGDIGIQVELTSIDNAQFLDTLNQKPESLDLVMTNWYMDYQDPSDNWEPLLQCGGSYNWAKYCNKDLDALFAKINVTPLGDARWAAFSDFEAKVAEQVPNLPLVQAVDYYFASARMNIETDPAVLLRFAEATVK